MFLGKRGIDTGSKAGGLSKVLVSYCDAAQHHNPEDLDLKRFSVYKPHSVRKGIICLSISDNKLVIVLNTTKHSLNISAHLALDHSGMWMKCYEFLCRVYVN
jgi:hypothetical protein